MVGPSTVGKVVVTIQLVRSNAPVQLFNVCFYMIISFFPKCWNVCRYMFTPLCHDVTLGSLVQLNSFDGRFRRTAFQSVPLWNSSDNYLERL